ncbi:hypothetical protein ACFPVX_13025 [Cohnella faecalis]|uniref:Uncharacterized protein n=1 Tax=Cohnella faecalis TaxID=2315694 RepID=A0A398CPI3_9BACL|nr:hypothetical protein [Cohnella faecalis]RIE04425.1 hypothetical protein D3H35_07525 [Cohnella faecalis]
MRTADQVKRKLNELAGQKKRLEALAAEEGGHPSSDRIARLEDQIFLLEWVLNEPTGSYHV